MPKKKTDLQILAYINSVYNDSYYFTIQILSF